MPINQHSQVSKWMSSGRIKERKVCAIIYEHEQFPPSTKGKNFCSLLSSSWIISARRRLIRPKRHLHGCQLIMQIDKRCVEVVIELRSIKLTQRWWRGSTTLRMQIPVSSLGRLLLRHNDDTACPMSTITQFNVKSCSNTRIFNLTRKAKTFRSPFTPLTLSGISRRQLRSEALRKSKQFVWVKREFDKWTRKSSASIPRRP